MKYKKNIYEDFYIQEVDALNYNAEYNVICDTINNSKLNIRHKKIVASWAQFQHTLSA